MKSRQIGTVAARRRAAVVAAIAGLSLAPYFWVAVAVLGWPGWDALSPGAPAGAFVDFYVDGSARIPVVATVAIRSWAIWLTLVVSVVRGWMKWLTGISIPSSITCDVDRGA